MFFLKSCSPSSIAEALVSTALSQSAPRSGNLPQCEQDSGARWYQPWHGIPSNRKTNRWHQWYITSHCHDVQLYIRPVSEQIVISFHHATFKGQFTCFNFDRSGSVEKQLFQYPHGWWFESHSDPSILSLGNTPYPCMNVVVIGGGQRGHRRKIRWAASQQARQANIWDPMTGRGP